MDPALLQAMLQIAIQVPAISVLGVVFLLTLKWVLNEQGRRIEHMADSWEKAAAAIERMADRMPR